MSSLLDHNSTGTDCPDSTIGIEVNEEEGCAYVIIGDAPFYPSLQDVVDRLKERDLPYWIDEGAIGKELEKRIIDQPFRAAFARDATFEISVDGKQQFASLTLKRGYGGKETTVADVQARLDEIGIVSGIDFERIALAVTEKSYNAPVVVARAKEPVHGTDARIDCLFPREFKMQPKETDHQKVDFRELTLIYAVAQGDVLARKIPATPGEPGITITGKTVPAKPGKDVKFSAGRNTIISSDAMEVTAAIAGQPFLKGRAVFVEPVYTIKGDIDYSVGNIDFKGSVKIDGNVVSGFSVKATESIEIDGVVEDCIIEAGMDVFIKGGILGADKGIVKAGRDFSALFVENCSVEAGRNIVVGDALNSELSAGDSIDVALGKGRVIGSKLGAQNLAAMNTLGSDIAGKTQVSVGYDPKTVVRLKNAKEAALKTEHTLEEIAKHICTLEGMSQACPLSDEKETLYRRLLATSEELGHRLEEITEEIAMLESTMTRSVQPTVRVRQTCYPNVRVTIGRLIFDCTTEYHSAVFFAEGEKIKVNVYENKA